MRRAAEEGGSEEGAEAEFRTDPKEGGATEARRIERKRERQRERGRERARKETEQSREEKR